MAASTSGQEPGRGYWAHETAIVDHPADIGEGTRIWHFCHVMAGARIGARCVLGQNVFVAARAVLGDGCKVQNNVSLYDDVEPPWQARRTEDRPRDRARPRRPEASPRGRRRVGRRQRAR